MYGRRSRPNPRTSRSTLVPSANPLAGCFPGDACQLQNQSDRATRSSLSAISFTSAIVRPDRQPRNGARLFQECGGLAQSLQAAHRDLVVTTSSQIAQPKLKTTRWGKRQIETRRYCSTTILGPRCTRSRSLRSEMMINSFISFNEDN